MFTTVLLAGLLAHSYRKELRIPTLFGPRYKILERGDGQSIAKLKGGCGQDWEYLDKSGASWSSQHYGSNFATAQEAYLAVEKNKAARRACSIVKTHNLR